MFCCILIAVAEPLSNFQLGLRGATIQSSNHLLNVFMSENFQYSLLGIPSLVIPLVHPFLANLNKPGIPIPPLVWADKILLPRPNVMSAKPGIFVIGPICKDLGSCCPPNTFPAVLAASFNDGPTNVIPPTKAVPSAPNFNLFLRIAAALSLPTNPSRLSDFELTNSCCNLFPPSASVFPNISPIVSLAWVDTIASPTAAGNTQ